MDFFNKMGETITNKGKDVARKAKDITEIARLSSQIAVQEASLNQSFQDIGRLVFENKSEWLSIGLAEKCRRVEETLEVIEHLKKDINDLKGIRVCPKCSGDVPENAVFCPACGLQMPVEEPEPQPENAEEPAEEPVDSVCPKCGQKSNAKAAYCASCGTKLEETQE